MLRFNVDNLADAHYWASAFDAFQPRLLTSEPRTFKHRPPGKPRNLRPLRLSGKAQCLPVQVRSSPAR